MLQCHGPWLTNKHPILNHHPTCDASAFCEMHNVVSVVKRCRLAKLHALSMVSRGHGNAAWGASSELHIDF